MKNANKKENSMEQKIYAALIGVGVFALAAVTIIYGVRMQKTNELARQEIQEGEQNPVTGPVAKNETEEKTTEDESKEAGNQSEDKVNPEPAEEKKDAGKITADAAGYNGKDKFAWPVSGNIIIPYSMDTTVYFETLDQYQCNPALYIKAAKGTEVTAVLEGTVSNVTENDRYGNQITLDVGNGYKMTYGQLDSIPYQKGELVEKGSVIGRIAEPTDYFALEGSHLYMKMTLQGKPVNPADYMEP
ncbi:MAG: M23 family peptidase [Lachnospiraceae bacterium]|nr:M23 family peptidase [Lachnospiraceae bacterium]